MVKVQHVVGVSYMCSSSIRYNLSVMVHYRYIFNLVVMEQDAGSRYNLDNKVRVRASGYGAASLRAVSI